MTKGIFDGFCALKCKKGSFYIEKSKGIFDQNPHWLKLRAEMDRKIKFLPRRF